MSGTHKLLIVVMPLFWNISVMLRSVAVFIILIKLSNKQLFVLLGCQVSKKAQVITVGSHTDWRNVHILLTF